MKRLLYIFAGLGLLTGCNTSGCLENRNALPLAKFYSSRTGTAISLSGLRVMGLPGDSTLLSPGTSASEVYMPFRPLDTRAEWAIGYEQENLVDQFIEDRLVFRYEAIPYFAGSECGAMLFYRITSLEYTTNIIDSVVIVAADSIVTNADLPTVNIYFRTATEGESDE